jgi:colanic acid/amylovoran biosynthesis protein
MCAKADLVYARDQTSYDYLKALMGTGSARVKVAPDIAFRFAGAPPLVGAEILIALGLARGATPILGITPNVRVYERMRGRGTRNAYIRLLADVIRHCLREWDASVVLVPHELTHRVGHHPDDRYLCGMLESMMNDPARVVSMKGDYSAAQLKSVIGNLDLLIGSRFHSLVFALSACTPVISIGWSHKYQELLSPFDLAEFSVDHASSSSGQFLDRLDLAWEQREKTRRHIGERLPNLLERVDAVFDETADLLRGRLRQSPYTG